MKRINFSVAITDLDGKDMKQGNEVMMINKIIGNMLSVAKPVKPDKAVRQLDVSLTIYKGKEAVEIDDEDVEMIKEVVKVSNTSALVAGQILKVLAKEETKKEDKSKAEKK